MPDSIFRYFPSVSEDQKNNILQLKHLYAHWNRMINVISRKDIDNFYLHHVLHSLSIAKLISFAPGTSILDVGTGGGFPGIPLAIIFPETQFTLLDSIDKKIKVVRDITDKLGLKNVRLVRMRAEEEKSKYDFVISRAVTDFQGFVRMTSKNISSGNRNSLANGIIYLKGGDIDDEIAPFSHKATIRNISDFFCEPFFVTKKIIYLPL